MAAIEEYPEFVPWCVSTRQILAEEQAAHQTAVDRVEIWEMAAGFKALKDSYQSRVTLIEPREIYVIAGNLRMHAH